MTLFPENRRSGPKSSRGDKPEEEKGDQIENNSKDKRPEIILNLIGHIPRRNKVSSVKSNSFSCVKTNLRDYDSSGQEKFIRNRGKTG
jgi:hypothetical protein